MEFTELVVKRRSVFKFTNQSVSLDDLLPALSLANFAPNHHLTQPWQFLWVGEQTKATLAEIYAIARATKKVGVDSPDFADAVSRANKKFLQIPAILMVACRVDDNPIVAEEDYASTCCAIQNLLLGIVDAGLGAQWSTHPMIQDLRVLSLLELSEEQRVVAMIYIGYPEIVPPRPPRKSIDQFIRVLC